MSITSQDLKTIVETIDAAIKKHAVTESDSYFHIDPEEHYKQHQRLERILTAYENAESAVWKWAIGILLAVGLLGAGIIIKAKGLLSGL